jgi:septal ring factor EnvC (AmiA/AmiB activator)
MSTRRHTITAPRKPIRLALVLVVGLGVIGSIPAKADPEAKLEAARDRLQAAQDELTQVTAAWQETEAKLARARDAVDDARLRIDELEDQLATIRKSLNDRVAAAFMSGGAPSIGALLTSDSIEEAADRLQYTQSVVQNDADLATEVAVTVEELRRQEARLRRAAREQARAADDLEAERDQIDEKVQRMQDVVQELKEELEAAQEAELGLGGDTSGGGAPVVSITGTGAIQTCPVAGPTSFVDSFGDPRPGGRTHEGIDMIAAYGTPVVAVSSGTARPAGSIGGLGVVLEHDSGGDWTFYAHLSSYGASGHVGVGTVIGYVGPENGVNHLHFEYHPAGGAAVDPYAALVAVC